MAQRQTRTFDDYINDYENTSRDYQEMGPLWAEMVFGDDFEAMRALYGGRDSQNNSNTYINASDDNSRRVRRR
jgi:hypothetical protein